MTSRIKRPLTVQEASQALVGTQPIGSIINGEFVTQWVGTLNGYPVSFGNLTKFDTEDEAFQAAANLRTACWQQMEGTSKNPTPEVTPTPEQSFPLSFDNATVPMGTGHIIVTVGYAQRRAKKHRPYCRVYVQQDGIELGCGWLEADFSWLDIEYHGEGATTALRDAVWEGINAIASYSGHRRQKQMAPLVQELLAESEKKNAKKQRK